MRQPLAEVVAFTRMFFQSDFYSSEMASTNWRSLRRSKGLENSHEKLREFNLHCLKNEKAKE